ILPGSTFTPTSGLPGFPLPPTATFSGKFRLPFTLHRIAVYENDRGRPVPVLPGERALGDPTVRVEVGFDWRRPTGRGMIAVEEMPSVSPRPDGRRARRTGVVSRGT